MAGREMSLEKHPTATPCGWLRPCRWTASRCFRHRRNHSSDASTPTGANCAFSLCFRPPDRPVSPAPVRCAQQSLATPTSRKSLRSSSGCRCWRETTKTPPVGRQAWSTIRACASSMTLLDWRAGALRAPSGPKIGLPGICTSSIRRTASGWLNRPRPWTGCISSATATAGPTTGGTTAAPIWCNSFAGSSMRFSPIDRRPLYGAALYPYGAFVGSDDAVFAVTCSTSAVSRTPSIRVTLWRFASSSAGAVN